MKPNAALELFVRSSEPGFPAGMAIIDTDDAARGNLSRDGAALLASFKALA